MTDKFEEQIPNDIKYFLKFYKKDLINFSKPNVWISLGQITFEYVLIALSIYICIYFWSIPLYIITLMFIASRQHGLGIIMHDGTHFLICKNKKINNIITTLFLSLPILTPLSKYRHSHFLHHRKPLTDNDPDWIPRKPLKEWHFPQPKKEFLKMLFQYAFFIHMLNVIFSFKLSINYKIKYFLKGFIALRVPKKQPESFKPKDYFYLNILFYVLVLAIVIYFNVLNYFILFWLFPILFWIPFIHRLRSIAEHSGVKNKNVYNRSRTMYPNFIDRFFLGANWNATYHLDHHLFPSIPSYRLKKFHKLLKNLPEYQKHAHVTKNGFYGVYKECTTI